MDSIFRYARGRFRQRHRGGRCHLRRDAGLQFRPATAVHLRQDHQRSVVCCCMFLLSNRRISGTHTHTHTHTRRSEEQKKEKEKKETCLRVFFCNNCFPMDFRARFTNDGVSRMSIEFRRPEGVHGLMSSHSPSERPFSHAFRSSSFVLVSFGLDFRL